MNISSVDRILFATSVSLISSLIGSDITISEFKITLRLRSISVLFLLRSPFTADLDEAFECLAEAELPLGAGAGAGLSLTSRDWAVVSGSDSAPAVAVSAPAVATVAELLLLLGAGLVLSSSEVTVSRPPEAVSRVVAASVSASSVATEVTLSTEVVASTGPALLAGLVLRTSDELVLATASLVAGLLVVT